MKRNRVKPAERHQLSRREVLPVAAEADVAQGFLKPQTVNGSARTLGSPSSPAPRFRHSSVAVLTRSQKIQHFLLALLWAGVTTSFWYWWLSHTAHSSPGLYWTQTVVLLYQTTFLPTLYWLFVLKMRKPVEVPARPGMRVAMATLCVPSSESFEVIQE